jgi:predicted RNA-binding protein associated with RNAse of E/G family
MADLYLDIIVLSGGQIFQIDREMELVENERHFESIQRDAF